MHALAAGRNGRLIGASESDACVFSFYANKTTITTGEGGMITTRVPIVAARARIMRTHDLDRAAFDRFNRIGASWSNDVVAPGYKGDLTDLATAIGVARLERVYEFHYPRHRGCHTTAFLPPTDTSTARSRCRSFRGRAKSRRTKSHWSCAKRSGERR